MHLFSAMAASQSGSDDEVPEVTWTVKPSLTITHTDSAKPVVFEAIVVEGKTFIHAESKSRKLERALLFRKSDGRARCKQVPVLIHKITECRDDKFRALMEEKGLELKTGARYTHKDVKHHMLSLPEVIQLSVPGVQCPVEVVCSKPCSKLWLHVTPDVLDALRAAVTALPSMQASPASSTSAVAPHPDTATSPTGSDD